MGTQTHPRLLFVGPEFFPSFVENDYMCLRREYAVSVVTYPLQTRPFQLINNPLKRLHDCFSMMHVVSISDLAFIWFANIYALLAIVLCKIFRKKSILVAGGIDAAYVPRIRYGIANFFWGRIVSQYCFRNADLVLSVSEYNKKEVLALSRPKRIEVVFNGIDVDFYRPEGKKEARVLTVAGLNPITYRQKGFETLRKVASFLPQQEFTVVADMRFDYAQNAAHDFPTNVMFKGPLTREELLSEYRRSRVYFQPSEHESFGVALAEAMACDCVPVTTAKGALPEVVGEEGYCSNDPQELARTIDFVLHNAVRKSPRSRVVENYQLRRRERSILVLTKDLKR